MSQELKIPILKEIISRGEPRAGDLEISTDDNYQLENSHAHPEDFDIFKPEPIDLAELENDDIEEFSSVQELLIEEEVRMILDKHMENAYEEIIRLIHHHIKR
jgi:hypothetical protein